MSPSILLLASLLGAEPQFSKVKEVDGILLESREVARSDMAEYRLTGTSPSPVKALCDAAFGNGKLTKNDAYVESRAVLKESEDERITYDKVSAPLISRRDYALRMTRIREENGNCRVVFTTANELAPPKCDGCVRIEKLRGEWKFEAADAKTKITYLIHTDPGGSTPAFLIEGSRKDSSIELFKRVVKRAAEK